jgi:hypothetical protein
MHTNNLPYFQAPSMRELHAMMSKWQRENSNLLSFSIQLDGDNFCCIALAGKSRVVICDPKDDDREVNVTASGHLAVSQ